jgi:uncharacterized protein (TIGR03435 family)
MRMGASWIYSAVGVLMVGCTSGITLSQNATNIGAQQPQMMPKEADPDWEVVTIKPNNTGEKRDRMDVEGRHVIAKNETVEAMLVTGFNVQKNQIVGLPDWARTEHWDADGVPNVEGRLDVQQWQSMMRKLLDERFGLKLHKEQREMSVFALITARGGPKLTANASDSEGHPIRNVRVGDGQRTDTFTNTSMSDLATMLLFSVDKPIVDHTGLKGRYDFKLQWSTNDANASAADAPPGLFTAMQEQLGLKLEAVRAQADVLVVDAVAKPTPN